MGKQSVEVSRTSQAEWHPGSCNHAIHSWSRWNGPERVRATGRTRVAGYRGVQGDFLVAQMGTGQATR